ncbi:uncharacterized protein IL334_001135 [Kwoniella shivajii]|uniref:Uncharacterized protein n=1 Tax=Kwoniella shivajii TaxID=564305 RepID=A0ABZ1CU62_9TREE|nr:hypothetical protein IL334_001135 [Kwoniella shivajii]
MSSPSKTPSIPSRSSSQLSLDSHLSSPRKRYDKPTSSSTRPSLSDGIRPPSAIYLGGEETSSPRRSSEYHTDEPHHPPLSSPHIRMTSGFAGLHVGIGSPKLDFGRRDWVGSNKSSTETSPEVKQEEHPNVDVEQKDEAETRKENDLVDRISGLPSPPGTESDIAPAGSASSKSTVNGYSRGKMPSSERSSPSTPKSPPSMPFLRTSSTGSAQLLIRRTSSRSGSSTNIPDSPQLRKTGLRPKHSPSLSTPRSTSSSSNLAASPSAVANRSTEQSPRRSSTGLSRNSSRSSNLSLGEKPNPSIRKSLAPLDTKKANYPGERLSSPERTARLPPANASIDYFNERCHSRSSSRDLREESVEEEPVESSGMSRSKSQGSELDDKIREAEERIAQAAIHRRRRSMDVEKNSTPSRQPIRRHDSYSRTTGSPMAATTSSGLKRTTTLLSALTDSPADSIRREDKPYDTPEKGNEERERSGGSSSSRKRKGLPSDFRHNSSLFTPSPQKLKGGIVDDAPGSTRSSRLRQFIDSPSDYHSSSPIPSRFSTSSRRSGEQETVPSPSRGNHNVDGLERSSSMAGIRGETSGHPKRNWSQSISGLPRASEELDPRAPLRERFRSETVLGGPSDRSTYQSRMGEGRRGMSTLVSERDLLSASSRSRLGALGPGDSVSAVGARSERGESKDPLEMIKRLEEQRAESKRRWEHMPRPATSMSGIREMYNNPPGSAPTDPLRHRRSIDHDSPLSPPFIRGGASRLGMRGAPSTEPRSMRSSTSLGGRSSANFDLGSSSTEHGRLLFEAFRVLDSRVGQDILGTQPELMRTFHSATRTSETINSSVRNALQLASQIAIDAELDDPVKVRHEYSNLAFLLRDAGRASEQNIRDMTRILLDLPKILRIQASTSGMTSSTSGGNGHSVDNGRLRRSESASLSSSRNGIMSEERARRWQPTSPVNQLDRSPLQGRYSMDSPRRSNGLLRSSTSMADSCAPLSSSKYSRDKGTNNNLSRPGSTVSSLMSKVKSMTPRKSFSSHSPKLDLSTIEQSPPPPLPPLNHNYKVMKQTSPAKSPERPRNTLRKKTSTLSTNTIKGSTSTSNFLPTSSGVKPTTAISQITAGDSSPPASLNGLGIGTSGMNKTHIQSNEERIDEPNSPMSRFSYRSQKSYRTRSHGNGHGHERTGSYETLDESDEPGGGEQHGSDDIGGSYETDAVSLLEQRLVQASKMRDERASEDKDELKRPSLSDRFRASLRKG